MVWPLVAMLAISAAKAYQDNQQAKSDKKYNAEIMRYSPWTGMKPGAAKGADTFGTMAQGLGAGMAMEQGAVDKPDAAASTAGAPPAANGLALEGNQAPALSAQNYGKPQVANYADPNSQAYSPWRSEAMMDQQVTEAPQAPMSTDAPQMAHSNLEGGPSYAGSSGGASRAMATKRRRGFGGSWASM